MREELLVRAVHLGKVVHGRDEHVDLDDLLQRGAGGGEHIRQVRDALLGHLGDAMRGEREDLAGGCAWDLAGAVDGAVGLDGLGIRACCWEGVSIGCSGGLEEGEEGN